MSGRPVVIPQGSAVHLTVLDGFRLIAGWPRAVFALALALHAVVVGYRLLTGDFDGLAGSLLSAGGTLSVVLATAQHQVNVRLRAELVLVHHAVATAARYMDRG